MTTNREWTEHVRTLLPPRVAAKINWIIHQNATFLVFFSPGGRSLAFPAEQMATDEMIARICLECP